MSKTTVSIKEDGFLVNGRPTYEGVSWNGHKVEGLLMNSRMVQGIYDDLNPQSRTMWKYPDGSAYDADRNTSEFIENMPLWNDHGVISFTINLQGGSPQGYSKEQPWINSAIAPNGDLRPDYMARLKRILDRADELGMVVILGIYYFGQEPNLEGPEAVRAGVRNSVQWVLDHGYTNVIIEVNNESNIRYKQPLLTPAGVHEMIELVKSMTKDGRRLLAGTSFGGGYIPPSNVVKASDFLLIHGNHRDDPEQIRQMVRDTRAVEGYRPMPILFNEDDHFDFDKPDNNFIAALGEYASWGYFDYRIGDEGYDDGYQSVPVNWGISSDRKRGFFGLAKKITTGN